MVLVKKKIISIGLVTLVVCCMMFTACDKNKGDDPATDDFDRKVLLTNISNNLILPCYSDFSAKTPSNEGEMIQQFGYVEVPVELNYAVTDGKLGVNIIGGVSSLFLVDNSISLESGNLKTDIGEANNINSLNFSTNVGLGLNYKVTPKIQLNVEPVFKYQLNTFSNSSGNFQPFSLGVYSGLSFKF